MQMNASEKGPRGKPSRAGGGSGGDSGDGSGLRLTLHIVPGEAET